MLKNIEKYLLTHYPIIWNLKIVPAILIVLIINIVFFGLGFAITMPLTKVEASSQSWTFALLIGCAILLQVLVFIFWLMQYTKHNALRAFYPQSAKSRYLEWLLTFILLIFIVSVPQSVSMGQKTRWKTMYSKQEFEKESLIMRKIVPLYPNNEYPFKLRDNESPLLIGNAKVDRSKFDTQLYTYEQDAQSPDNPIEYVGPSFLYFHDYYYNGLGEKDNEEELKIRQWLESEQQDSIRATIQAYLDLHKKYNLKANIDADTWMKIVYNPPLYPVDLQNTIDMSDDRYNASQYSTQYWLLKSQYQELDSVYNSKGSTWYMYTWVFAMGISILVFSVRATNGRSWLFALITFGITILFSSFLLVIFGSGDSFFVLTGILWIGILIGLGIHLRTKIALQERKGRSSILLNLFIWIAPALTLLLFMMGISIFNNHESEIEDKLLYLVHPLTIVIYTTIIMYPICILVRQWKALPED